MNIVQFIPDHAEYIIQHGQNKGAPNRAHVVGKISHQGFAWTGLKNGFPVGSAGIIPMWDGTAEAWVLASERVHENPFRFAKTVKSIFNELVIEHGLHRIQAAVRADWPEAQRFAEFMGVENEGLMRKFGQDKTDYIRYARVL